MEQTLAIEIRTPLHLTSILNHADLWQEMRPETTQVCNLQSCLQPNNFVCNFRVVDVTDQSCQYFATSFVPLRERANNKHVDTMCAHIDVKVSRSSSMLTRFVPQVQSVFQQKFGHVFPCRNSTFLLQWR